MGCHWDDLLVANDTLQAIRSYPRAYVNGSQIAAIPEMEFKSLLSYRDLPLDLQSGLMFQLQTCAKVCTPQPSFFLTLL